MSDLEKWRSIGIVGRTRGKARVRPLVAGGKTRGAEVEYQDGRQAAFVRPEPVRASFSLSEGDVTDD